MVAAEGANRIDYFIHLLDILSEVNQNMGGMTIIPTYSPVQAYRTQAWTIGTTRTKNTLIFMATYWLQKICGRYGLSG